MQHIIPLMLGFRMQLCNTLFLLPIVRTPLLHMRQLPLLPGDAFFQLAVGFEEVSLLSVGIHIQFGRDMSNPM